MIQLGGEVGCMINEGHWVFVGIPNAVKVGNLKLLFLKFIVRCNGSFLSFFYLFFLGRRGGGEGRGVILSCYCCELISVSITIFSLSLSLGQGVSRIYCA